jgi:Tubulin/FtsZ family, GTPase domain
MNKRKILLIGCGKAGNKLVNEMLKKDARYTGLFVNSAYNDMAKLEKFNEDNAFLFSGANGSGRNREVAKQFVKNQIQSLVDTVASYPMHDVITIFTSADGGTGSGITPMLIQLLKVTYNAKKLDKKINLVAVMPNYGIDDKVAFENSISFWNDIMKIKDDCLDDIKLIDNSKGDNFAEINQRVVNELNNAYSMNGESDEGDIDDKDAKVFNTEKGFGLVLNLSDEFKTAKHAIDNAIKNSIFALPNSYECNYLGISVKKDSYNLDDVKSCFDTVYKTTYRTYNNKHNTVVLGGCDIPSEIIEMIKVQLDDINSRVRERETNKKVIIEMSEPSTHGAEKKKESSKATFTEDEIEDISNALLDIFS